MMWRRAIVIARPVLANLALVVVGAWTAHTLVLSGNTLLAQHPLALLRTSPIQSHQQPPGGYLQAVIAADDILPAKASVALVNRTGYVENYAYYWASYKMYPLQPVMADSIEAAAVWAPNYIVDIRGPWAPAASGPQSYVTVSTRQFADGTVLTVLTHA
jgi:hypothetical protein